MRSYRFRDLKGAGVPFCRKHVRHLEKLGEFPMHFDIGANTVSWVADEVDAWVEVRVRRRALDPGIGLHPRQQALRSWDRPQSGDSAEAIEYVAQKKSAVVRPRTRRRGPATPTQDPPADRDTDR
jgi:prophage regulatory protein